MPESHTGLTWRWHVQERRGKEITSRCLLQDLRAQYLHAVAAVVAEGFEKGYVSGEQNATAYNVIENALDHIDQPLNEMNELSKLVHTPIWLRVVVKVLSWLGHMLPIFERWASQVLPLTRWLQTCADARTAGDRVLSWSLPCCRYCS